MRDFVIGIVIILISISPFILYHLGKKKISFLNSLIVVLYFASWVYILVTGIPFSLNIITVVWLVSLALALLCLLLSAIQFFLHIHSDFNKYALAFVLLVVIIVSYFIFMNLYEDKGVISIIDLTMLYTIPLFLASLFLIAMLRFDKQSS